MDKKYFKDKVIIITGASSGIGLASARLFGSCGAKVVMAARHLDVLEAEAPSVNPDPDHVLCVKTDVSAEADDLHREYVLSQIRQQIGFTQADVAERLGVSQPTYAECERGSNMRIGTLQKIVAALGGELSFHVLIGGRDYNLQMP